LKGKGVKIEGKRIKIEGKEEHGDDEEDHHENECITVMTILDEIQRLYFCKFTRVLNKQE
jgi:hypothetical protein